jgi:hypothetical protein
MRTFTQQFSLFLIIAMVLSPVQHAFAMQMATQGDSSTQLSAPTTASMSSAHADSFQTGSVKMLGNNCSQHGKSGSCKSANKCGSCPLSLEIPQASLKRVGLSVSTQSAITDVSLNSSGSMPDYRPPRNP